MSLSEKLSLIVTSIGLWNCTLFCVVYSIRARGKPGQSGKWWKTEHGVWVMVSQAILGSLFMLIVSYRVFGDWPGRNWLLLAMYILYVAGTAWPLRLVFVSEDDRRKRASGSSSPGSTVGEVD